MAGGPIDFLLQSLSLVVGIPLLALGLCLTKRRRDLHKSGQRARVQVVGYEARDDFDGGTKWQHPVVRFAGQRLVLNQGERGRMRWAVGSWLEVCYRQDQPERMIVDRAGEMFFIPATVVLMALGIIGFGWL